MPAFARITLTDKLACQASPTTYGILRPEDLEDASDVQAIDDAESLSFRYSRVDAFGKVREITAQMRAGRVLTVLWSDGSFDEWRVGSVTDGRGLGGLIDVQGVPLWQDLVERADAATGKGWVSELVGAERVFDYEISERTASSILSTFVIPNLPSWVTLGTVNPTVVIPSLSVNHLTPWALAIATRDALRNMDVPCELRLRRNGTTGYELDLVTQVGSSADTPVFHPANALLTLRRKTDPTLQATRVLVDGGTAPDTLPGVLGRARWRVGAPVGTTVPLTDRNSGASPIAFDNQWVGAFLLRVKTGRTFPITSSSAAAGTVTCSGGLGSLAEDEDVELRLTEPLTNTRRLGSEVAATAYNGQDHWEITAVGASDLTITAKWGMADPLTADNQFLDWYVRRATYKATTSFTMNGVAGRLDCASVAGISVGDLLAIGTQTSSPYGIVGSQPGTTLAAVDSIDSTNKYLYVHFKFAGTWQLGATTLHLRAYTPVATLHRITGSVAATNVVSVDAVGTAAVNDLAEFVQVDGNGEIPAYVDHPTYSAADPVGYGIKCMELSRPNNLGISQLVQNSWMRLWANSANPPDGGWSTSGTGTLTRVASPSRFGGYAWQFAAGTRKLMPAPLCIAWRPGSVRLSARAWMYLTSVGATALSVYAATTAGAAGTLLGRVTVVAVGAGTGSPEVQVSSWVELKIEGLQLSDANCRYGVLVELDTGGSAGYLDTIEAYPFAACPYASYEFGDAQGLMQAGNRKLAEVASPPAFYEFTVRDLERAFPTEFSRLKLTLGGSVRAADIEYGIDTTVRLLRMARNLLRPTETALTLGNRPLLFTAIARTGTTETREATSALVSSAGSAPALTAPAAPVNVTTYTAAATIPAGASVVTTSSPPALTVSTDATLVIRPSVSTAPDQGVAIENASAPRRVRPSYL